MLTLWFTGLSAAGKSTVASQVAEALRAQGKAVEVLDGDALRAGLSRDLGFSKHDRDEQVRRVAYVADLLSRNGVLVLAAVISPYRAARDGARALIGERFVEIHVSASVAECARRDPRGLYQKALHGELDNFTGVSDPYEPPLEPELLLETERETPDQSAAKVLAYVESRISRAGEP